MTTIRENWGRTPFKMRSVPFFPSGDDDNLAFRLARSEQIQRLDGPFQRERGRYVRLELAFAVPASELARALGKYLRLAPREIPPEDAHDGGALQQREIQRQLGNFARRKADHEQAPAPRDRAERRLGVRASDRVVDHVHTLAGGDLLDALAQVLDGVVDRLVRAVLAAHFELFRARFARDDTRAPRLADLDRGDADPARFAEPKKRLALAQR